MLSKLIMWIPKNIGAIFGIVQTFVEFVREVCMLAARTVCGVIPGDADDKAVEWLRLKAQMILDFLEKCKNWFLGLGFKI